MILIFITCKNAPEAKKIGLALVRKRLVACSVIVPGATSFYWWPPRKNKVEQSREAILLLKTLPGKFSQIEREVKKLHSYTIPCILALRVADVNKSYLEWLLAELMG